MDRQKRKNNMIIGGLLAVVLLMAVGYAAFATRLQINGTANIDSNFCIGFDSRNTNAYVATPGLSGATTPTASITFTGTACETNYKTNASLAATFKQPGDKVVYTLTIANKGNIAAAIESITVDNQTVTSDQTITKDNIKYTVKMPGKSSLTANDTTTMEIIAEFQNDTDIEKYTTGETQSINVKINAVQSNGSNAMNLGPSAYTGTIYRWANNEVGIGDSIAITTTQTWCAVGVLGNSCTDGNLVFDTPEECEDFISEVIASGDIQEGDLTCQQGTPIESGGIGEYIKEEDYPSASARATALGEQFYLKHTVVNDIITENYVCFISDSEHCMRGGDTDEYSNNQSILQGYQTYYNLNIVAKPTPSNLGCSFDGSHSICYGGKFRSVNADSYGEVNISNAGYYCSASLTSNCNLRAS